MMNDHYFRKTSSTKTTTAKENLLRGGVDQKIQKLCAVSARGVKFLSSSSESTIVPVFFAFFFATLLSLLFLPTTGLSFVTILANASCTVGSNVYDADFALATI